MITNITTLKEEDAKVIMKGIKTAINDAVENSLEYLTEHSIIGPASKKKKEK